MPHHIAAAILLQLDQPHIDKQELLCVQYAGAAKLHVIAVCRHNFEALSMIMAGTVAAVITAVNPGGSLAEDLARFGGQLHIVRGGGPPPARDMGSLAKRMYSSGLDTQQIATILQMPPEQVRRHRDRRRNE